MCRNPSSREAATNDSMRLRRHTSSQRVVEVSGIVAASLSSIRVSARWRPLYAASKQASEAECTSRVCAAECGSPGQISSRGALCYLLVQLVPPAELPRRWSVCEVRVKTRETPLRKEGPRDCCRRDDSRVKAVVDTSGTSLCQGKEVRTSVRLPPWLTRKPELPLLTHKVTVLHFRWFQRSNRLDSPTVCPQSVIREDLTIPFKATVDRDLLILRERGSTASSSPSSGV
jgi:hypothetical protein